MFTIFWPPLSFLVIHISPPKRIFIAKFFGYNILPDMLAATPACGPVGD
jgi:hypothetical protein